jgi:hypothetical protein
MRLARPFFHNQTKENLIHLNEGQVVGEWRDSTYGTSITTHHRLEKISQS